MDCSTLQENNSRVCSPFNPTVNRVCWSSGGDRNAVYNIDIRSEVAVVGEASPQCSINQDASDTFEIGLKPMFL